MDPSDQPRVLPRLEAIASRPRLPEGYGVPDDSAGLLSWAAVAARFAEVQVYWIGTTHPHGRPHAVPIWGAVVDGYFFCEGSPDTRWGRNLSHQPAMNVHAAIGELCVMVAGEVERVTALEDALFTRVAEEYAAKYAYRPATSQGMCVLHPQVAFAWDHFPSSVTRWHFRPVAR